MPIELQVEGACAALAAWNARGVVARAELLSRGAANLTIEAAGMAQWQIVNALSQLAAPIVLPGPTGESNQSFTTGRGLILVSGDDSCSDLALSGALFAALVAGNVVVVAGSEAVLQVADAMVAALRRADCPSLVVQLAQTASSIHAIARLPKLSAVAFCGDATAARTLNADLAARDGPVIPLIEETDLQRLPIVGHPDYVWRFITERTLTENTAAVGGNALLLSQSGD